MRWSFCEKCFLLTLQILRLLSELLKNWGGKHGVTDGEAEEIFFNDPLVAGADVRHSEEERRFCALGSTDSDRPLFVVFTVRDQQV